MRYVERYVQYVIYLPFLVKALHTYYFGGQDVDNWCFHMLLVSGLRFLHNQLWMTFSRLHCVSKKYQVHTTGVTFEQVDREFHSSVTHPHQTSLIADLTMQPLLIGVAFFNLNYDFS